MKQFRMRAALIAGSALIAFSSPASAALKIGDFTGGVLFPTGVGNIFYGMNRNVSPMNLSGGSVVFDDALIPASGTGFVNVALGVTTDDALSFFAGTQLTADRGDLISGGVAAIQYNNGVFNGIVFQTDFSTGGQTYQLAINGGAWNINNVATGALAASGYINIGRTGLTNIRDYVAPTAPVPEPATWAMMVAGFGAVGFAMRRRQTVRVSFA
ncbi:MAG: PEPxxWA-CTERM sorting domain-containing protein [Sphingomonadales bacterium]